MVFLVSILNINAALFIFTSSKFKCHSSPFLIKTDNLNIFLIIEYYASILMFQKLNSTDPNVFQQNRFMPYSYHSILIHSSTVPSYVTDMLHKKPLHTRNTRSSSYTMPLLNRPAHSKATLGDRSFSFASSSVWNSISNDVRCAPSLSSFKSRLKTYLFCSVYKD